MGVVDVAGDFCGTDYGHYLTTGLYFHHRFILPCVERVLGPPSGRRMFEIGFGSGAVMNHFARLGFDVGGIEPSATAVAHANAAFPALTDLRQGSAYDDFPDLHNSFDVVISLEVIEHLYAPRRLVALANTILKPNGMLILSTPYHGYLKNLAIALLGKCDQHASPLWDDGHIKFWSPRTMLALLIEAGFSDIKIERVGRIPVLAKSMVITARQVRSITVARRQIP